MIDITVTVIFHREGAYAIPALSSMRLLTDRARASGLNVEARAVMDRPDDMTLKIVAERGNWLDGIEEVSFGDLGLSRNAGIDSAQGRFLSFLDGDDLWGEDWLVNAYRAATLTEEASKAIWHPQYLYYFSADDFDRHSVNDQPHPAAGSFHFVHHPSNSKGFDRNALFLENLYSANGFALKKLHLKYPYKKKDTATGFGVEDWSWNIETIHAGVHHQVVADTVHLIRLKNIGSLGIQNGVEGLLPHLPDNAFPTFGQVTH
ncbi:MAG: glycosyltransferase family 2 protein [Chlorobiaceae bacterium]|nr:glycosyltransferase family 2 protein [Chlorobiaceae bacterium]